MYNINVGEKVMVSKYNNHKAQVILGALKVECFICRVAFLGVL